MKNLFKSLCVLSLGIPSILLAQTKPFVLKGKIISDTLTKGVIYLSYVDNGKVYSETGPIVNNTFQFKGKMEDAGVQVNLFLRDSLSSKRFRGFSQFYIQSGESFVTLNSNFVRTDIKGSLLQKQMDSVDNGRKQLRKEHSDKLVNDYEFNFIKTHPNSWLSFVLLQTHLIRGNDISLDKADSLYGYLSSSLKKYPAVKSLKGLIDGRKNAAVGNPAIDFSEKDIAGNTIKLSSYRGKYVLIDFWASWCHPCREENPNLTAAYHKYKDKGLNILSISLDGTRDSWIKAVNQDKLEWLQVSNLKAFEDESVLKYGIHSIPSNFLIDPKGIIVAKNLRGEELQQKFAEIFK